MDRSLVLGACSRIRNDGRTGLGRGVTTPEYMPPVKPISGACSQAPMAQHLLKVGGWVADWMEPPPIGISQETGRRLRLFPWATDNG